MDLLKRILAIAVIVISVVGILICTGAIIGSWAINTPITNAITQTLTGVERVLTTAETTLGHLDDRLGDIEADVVAFENEVFNASDTIIAEGVIPLVIQNTVGDKIAPKIESARATTGAIVNSVVALNDTLVAANEIPFVDVPTLDTQLDTLNTRVGEVEQSVADTRAEMLALRENRVSQPVDRITTLTGNTTDRLNAAQTSVSTAETEIGTFAQQISAVNARVPGILDLISIAVTLVFLWLVFAQVGLIVHAYWYLKGHSPLQTKAAA